jgi:hypothetical protein
MAGGLVLADADTSLAQLFNVDSPVAMGETRVIPFQPDASYLIKKLENAVGSSGQQVPLGGTPLSPTDIGHIRDWITGGALR